MNSFMYLIGQNEQYIWLLSFSFYLLCVHVMIKLTQAEFMLRQKAMPGLLHTWLTYYLLAALALLISTMFAGTGLLCNVIIINIHHHRPNKKLPRWVRKVFLEKLACCLCMSQKEKVQPLKVYSQFSYHVLL